MEMSQYKDLFIAEAGEYVQGMGELIMKLEGSGGGAGEVDALFRLAHSMKGMAATMGYAAMAGLAHRMEDVMDRVRKGTRQFTRRCADLLLEATDMLRTLLNDLEGGGSGEADTGDITGRLAAWLEGEEGEARDKVLPAGPAPDYGVGDGGAAAIAGERSGQLRTVRVRTELLDRLVNTTGELITNRHRLTMIGKVLDSPELDGALGDLSRLLRELHTQVMEARLIPFATIADRFPRTIRDLARRSGKECAFVIEGKEIELDRAMLEELSDPLVHLLRNAMDHGLEPGPEREAAGKPTIGRITLSVRRDKDRVVVTVEDDGRGMDPAGLIESAMERGLIRPEERESISPGQAFMLTCIPGFSTAREVTDISGRGVGMDVVRASVLSMGGSLAIDSRLGTGTRITIGLPLTTAIIQTLLVACASLTVGIPVARVFRTLELERGLIRERKGRKLFHLQGEEIPLLSLNRLLGAPFTKPTGKCLPTLVTEMGGRKVGLVVDRFEGNMELFVKPLGRPLDRLRGVAGGAVLGDGRVVLILDTAGLI